jgi:ligand-binding sensor domain-containing protein
VGTASGLYIVDIRTGAVIDRIEAGPRLPSSSVRGIAATGDSVFVATDDGLVLFRGGTATVFTARAPGALPTVPLARLCGVTVGNNRDVLLSTLGLGAGVITPAGGYTLPRSDSLLDDIVFDVRDRPTGARYFATNAGLCAQLNDTTFAWYQAGAGLPRGETRQLAIASDGSLHILVSRQGIYRFANGRASRLPAPDAIPLRDALSISAGADGSIWAAGRGWVAVRRAGNWKRVDTGQDAASAWRTVVADGAGAFVGSDEGVVLALERGVPLRLALEGGLPAPRAAAIAPDGMEGAWFVSGGYLVRADALLRRFAVEDAPADARAIALAPNGAVMAAGRWTVRARGPGGWADMHPDVIEPDPAFTAARVDAGGALWVGTWSGAIYRYDGTIWLRIARGSQTMGGRGILDLRIIPGGTWAIGAGVPVRCVDGGVEHFAGIDSSEAVVDLERSPAGEWIALTSGRVFVFDDAANLWRSRTLSSLVPGSPAGGPVVGRLTTIAFDATGVVFAGSTEGLGVIDPNGTRWLRAADGIGGGAVADVVVDGGRLWVGFAQDGLSMLPLGALR